MKSKNILLFLVFFFSFIFITNFSSASPTGGTITYSGDYIIHTFNTSGSFNFTGDNLTVDILVIGGGGGGGGGSSSGGGGAGGMAEAWSYNLSAGNYTVVVGTGGAGGSAFKNGVNGLNSSFNGTIIGVGGGAGPSDRNKHETGFPGGSGGGGSNTATPVRVGGASTQINGTGWIGYGFKGGNGILSGSPYPGGGGGGAGGEGHTGIANGKGGDGGEGRVNDITGSAVCYAGGGGGAERVGNKGMGVATCGGGNASLTGVAGAGVDGTGGGGGAIGASGTGGKGGDGIVIIRYINTINSRSPENGTVLYRSNSTYLNATVSGIAGDLNVTFYNATNPLNNISLETFTNVPAGSFSTFISNLPIAVRFDWFVEVYDGVTTFTSSIYSLFANNEPALKNVYATINSTHTNFYWENEVDMEWVSLYLGNEWLELRSITSIFDSWSLTNVYPGRTYLFKWQTGDNLLSMSDMHNFTVRSYGWNTDLSNYIYRRLITLNDSLIGSDLENYAINLTLDENNFQWCTGSEWWDSCYPAFTHLNWTNLNDIRFTNDYDYEFLPFNVTYFNIPEQGGQSTQTIPNEILVTGSINDNETMYDGDWNSYSVPSPAGTYYFNYTIPAGAKTNSMFRLYDGEWFWDGQLSADCYGGTKLRFKSDIDYNTPYIKTYCQNNSDNTWISITNTTSAHFYETMMTWQYEADLQITILPLHYNDGSQSLTSGIDGDYSTRIWMYYGYSTAENNESDFSYDGIVQDNYTFSSEEAHILGVPIISNINDTEGRTATGTNVSWDVDQETDNRIKYSTNPFMLDSQYYYSTKTVSETFEHQYGNAEHIIRLLVYGNDYLSTVSVVCSNASYSANYTVNSSTGNYPVELNIPDLNTDEYLDWTITYSENKTWDRNTQRPEFDLAGLTTNTQYWYQVEAYGTRGNATSEIGTFTLGTVPSLPTGVILNYTETRPSKLVTVCANVTSLNGESSLLASFQYFNQTDLTFKETSQVSINSAGVFCQNISAEFGENNTYRLKLTTSSYSCSSSPYDSNCYYNFLDEGSCTAFSNHASQCSWTSYGGECYDGSYSWLPYFTEGECYANGGVYWDSYGSSCDGTLTCEAQISSDSCSNIYGCSWGATGAVLSGFSESYTNLFDNRYEFFIGNPVEDNQMYLDRQYCPKASDGTANLSATCYEEKGYREGSRQEETWAYFETNLSSAVKIEKLKYMSGLQKNGNITVQSISNTTLSSANGIKYTTLTGLDSSFYTFKVYDASNNLVLDWVKPSLTHRIHESRIDENAFVQFNGTPAPINYQIMYLKTPGTYNSSAYQWCQAQPDGNLYDCMFVQYWGTHGMGEELSGTKYDRGQFFRGGIANGEPADSGLLQSDRNINSISGELETLTPGNGDERFCYAFTIYYFDDDLIPTNNITNYYARYWREDQHYSQYLGINQDSEIDQWNLFNWEFDDISITRDWKEVNGTKLLAPSIVKTVNNSIFGGNFNQSLLVGYQEGFNMDVSKDKIYKSGIYFDGQWINQQIGKHQQGFVIFNLPDNATLLSLDSDADGLNDHEELYTYYSNPKSTDTDEDGMPDGVEEAMSYDLNDWTSVADCESVLFNGCTNNASDLDFTLNNTNAFAVSIFVNVQNALLHNGTQICTGASSNIKANNGLLNITIPANSVCHVSNDYTIVEGTSRANDVTTIHYTDSSERKVNISVPQIQNVNVSLSVDSCSALYKVDYTRSGYSSNPLSSYTCSEDVMLDKEQSLTKGDNIYRLTYNTISGGAAGGGAGIVNDTNITTTNQTNVTTVTTIVPDTPIQNVINNVVGTIKNVTSNIDTITGNIVKNPEENIPTIFIISFIGLLIILAIIMIIYYKIK